MQLQKGWMLLITGKDYSEAEALVMTFSINNYPAEDPRLAQAKLWEGAFIEEMQAFQRRMAGTFQVAFMAEVGGLRVLGSAVTIPVVLGQFPCPCPSPTPSWVALGSEGPPRQGVCDGWPFLEPHLGSKQVTQNLDPTCR